MQTSLNSHLFPWNFAGREEDYLDLCAEIGMHSVTNLVRLADVQRTAGEEHLVLQAKTRERGLAVRGYFSCDPKGAEIRRDLIVLDKPEGASQPSLNVAQPGAYDVISLFARRCLDLGLMSQLDSISFGFTGYFEAELCLWGESRENTDKAALIVGGAIDAFAAGAGILLRADKPLPTISPTAPFGAQRGSLWHGRRYRGAWGPRHGESCLWTADCGPCGDGLAAQTRAFDVTRLEHVAFSAALSAGQRRVLPHQVSEIETPPEQSAAAEKAWLQRLAILQRHGVSVAIIHWTLDNMLDRKSLLKKAHSIMALPVPPAHRHIETGSTPLSLQDALTNWRGQGGSATHPLPFVWQQDL